MLNILKNQPKIDLVQNNTIITPFEHRPTTITFTAHAPMARVNNDINTDNLVSIPLDESKMVTVFCPEHDSFP